MDYRHIIIILSCLLVFVVHCAVVLEDNEGIDQQGLYSKSDHIIILTNRNFEMNVYGQRNARIVQFYNSYCGHCRAFAPKFKQFAGEIVSWRNIIELAVIDCSVEENNEVCRNFEVMAYPTIRYIHENYVKANGNIGDNLASSDALEKLKTQIISKLEHEQSLGHLLFAPSLSISSYATYNEVLRDQPLDNKYTFLVFENKNSTVGAALALDINDYKNVWLKRVHDNSELSATVGITAFPAIIAFGKTAEDVTNLTPQNPTEQSMLNAANNYLTSKGYKFPHRDIADANSLKDESYENQLMTNFDVVYYTDLEKTIKTSLHTEITRYKVLTGEPLQALLDYLNILIDVFPSRGNLKSYLTELRSIVGTKNQWNGGDVYETVKSLESKHAPVYTSTLEYIGCKGSQPQYRGYSCGLWTLFHTLTVNALRKPGTKGPKVLKAMHGYIKHFFGCTECSQHFQAMAERNKIFEVKENDKAVLWLWISHNEVNLRLAGDITEDPTHPKMQFPSVKNCRECRLSRGAWNLPAVFDYLQNVFSAENIHDTRMLSPVSASSTFSTMDIGMLSLLYILSFIILIIVVKLFLSKRFYRKRYIKNGRGKV